MRYPYLLFDADNTLFDFDRAQAKALEKAMLELHGSFKPHYLPAYEEINHSFWAAFERGELSQEDIKQKRFKVFFDRLELSHDVSVMNALYLRGLSEGGCLLDGAHELIEKLAEEHSLLIITNGLKEVQRPRFDSSPLSQYFQAIVVSDEVGVAKPNPEIFDIAFDLLGSPAKKDVLMIGDSLSSDMQGGVNYGVATCWFNPRKKVNSLNLPLTHEIQTLASLSSFV